VFVSDDPTAAAEAASAGVCRDVILERPCRDIYVLHNRKAECDIYFLVNNSVNDYTGEVSFASTGTCQLWNAWTGRAYRVDSQSDGSRTAVALTLPGRTACFVVFGADEADASPADDSMWEFGPTATTLSEYAGWAAAASRQRYFGEDEPEPASGGPAQQLSWRALTPEEGLSVASSQDGEVIIQTPPWRRLGWVIEGAECELALEPGVYELELEARAENLDLWCAVPMHFAGHGEIYEKGIDMMHWRHSLDAPGPHDWQAWRFSFKVPEGATQTRIVLFPLDKTLFSREAQLTVRGTFLRRLSGK